MPATQFSWLQEEERLLELIAENAFHRTPLAKLPASFYYINPDNEIVHIFKTHIEFDSKTAIDWDVFYSVVKSASSWNDKQYVFEDAALHHISIDYGSIDVFNPAKSLHRILSNNPISLEPSLAVFHDLSELFVFMRESLPPRHKSILKSNGSAVKVAGGKTKKVRISEQSNTIFIIDRNHKRTRKALL
jgi:hypothetical protein